MAIITLLLFQTIMVSDETNVLNRPRSNRVPAEEELPRIRSLHQQCRASIDVINMQIEELVEQRSRLQADLEQYESLLSPIKRVPEDILATIFKHATEIKRRRFTNVLPAVIVSRVCQDWRKLAIQTPDLWSTLMIVPHDHPRQKATYSGSRLPQMVEEEERLWNVRMNKLMEVVPLWIARSKELPVSLTLAFRTTSVSRMNGWGGEDSPAAAAPLYKACVDLACSTAHRWKTVDLDIIAEDSDIVKGILDLKPEDLPRLESLSFQSSHDTRREEDPPFYPPASHKLGCIDETTVRGDGRLDGSGERPRSTINKLFGPRGVLSLLQSCPDLEHCELAVLSADQDSRDWVASVVSVRDASVVLPKLKALFFHGSEPVPEVMSSLHLPSLRQLHFLGSHVSDMAQAKRSVLEQRLLWSVGRFGEQLTDIRFSLLLLADTESMAHILGQNSTQIRRSFLTCWDRDKT
ncbi:hypothetical protein NMY22_g3323 [Coprinellus aureogranulatus]|nr:hypothetical protein NMY22_g3323 [Coprinellus aureogranulatus]